MKGLIIKDLMCLRKQRITFLYIVAVVLIVSVMFVLSAKFGNIAVSNRYMIAENDLSEIDVKNLSSLALVLFMMLPIAMVGDIGTLFTADGKAGFANVSAVLPISIEKRVLAKFVTFISFLGIGVGADIVISLILSLLTDMLSFVDFVAMIITGASALFIYCSLFCLYMFIFGYGKESVAGGVSLLTIMLALMVANFEKLKVIYISCFIDSAQVIDVNPINVIMDVIKDKCISVLIVAVVVGVLSYVLSVFLAKRKRGIV